jgi:serine/threonine-protein kinase
LSAVSSIGRYKVIRAIGQGGMGALFLAWDPRLGRHTAIKLLSEDDPELRERFAREARAAASIRHPHIVEIFDVGEHDGRPFIAMEYVHGRTLADLIRAEEPPTVARAVDLVAQLCAGLAVAHKAGIIHRDIKPANVMVNHDGLVKLLDFGVARAATTARMTRAGVLVGTLNYLSPEQVSGQPVDHRADVFAVGLVFYELLARRQAFAGGMLAGVLHKILYEQPEPLDTVRRGLPPEIVRIVEKALRKDPAQRYQDLLEMRRDLEGVTRTLRAAETPTMVVYDTRSLAARLTGGTGSLSVSGMLSADDRAELARLRALRLQAHVDRGRAALARGDVQEALAAAEDALVIDTENQAALELLMQARARKSAG